MGDPLGIGPEIILKALSILPDHQCSYVVYGQRKHFAIRSLKEISLERQFFEFIPSIEEVEGPGKFFIDLSTDPNQVNPTSSYSDSGRASIQSLERATEDLLKGKSDTLVTAPISKRAVQDAGFAFPGHTEFLAHHFKSEEYMMMLVHQNLRVALQTIHTPLSKVCEEISTHHISTKLRFLKDALRDVFHEPKPIIDVLGLNPHAGDEGVLGSEELDKILPAIEVQQSDDATIRGPFAADGYFARKSWKNCHCVLAMYHDQGLIPFKMLDEGAGVNVTLGLPIIRTSPDHGTAFDIAGKGIASATSMLMAIQLAESLTENRFNGTSEGNSLTYVKRSPDAE